MTVPVGEVVTFYSYSGGTGRTQALANVARALARGGERVLAVDWNLESPGLHHLLAPVEEGRCGLIEMFGEASGLLGGDAPEAVIEKLKPCGYAAATSVAGVDVLAAGRFGDGYFQSVSAFDWRGLDERAPWLIGAVVDAWRRQYRYILIDSRSGVNEMSGMCTMMLPDKLVLFFVPSRASVEGVAQIARFASEYRNEHRLEILPVPARVETLEGERAERFRYGSGGYQSTFEALLAELNHVPRCRLQSYFSDVEQPYSPRHAFGEGLVEDANSPLGRAYEKLAARIRTHARPWEEIGAAGEAGIEVDGQLLPFAEAEARLLAMIPMSMAKRDNAALASTLDKLAFLEARAGRMLEARAYYQQALALMRALGSKEQIASLQAALGEFELKAGNADEAVRNLTEALETLRENGGARKAARTLESLAAAELAAQRLDSARGHYQELIEMCRADRDAIGVACGYLKLGEIERNGDLALARTHLETAAGVFRRERDNDNLAACLRALAHVQLRAGNYEEAERSYEQCLEISRGTDPSQRAQTLLGLATVDRKLRKYDEADRRYRAALDLFEAAGNKPGLALTLQRLAELELRSGSVEQAREHYMRAFETLKETNDPRAMATVAMGLGDLARRTGDLDEAYKRYESAMELYRGLYNSLGQANALLNLGDLERRRGQLEPARERYHQALQLFKPTNGRLGMANTLKSLGDLELEAAQLRLARQHYLDASELYKSEQNQLGLANAYQGLGDVERRRLNLTEARKLYEAARDLYVKENSATGLAYTYSELARVSHMLCDFGASIAFMNQAIGTASQLSVPAVEAYVWQVGAQIRGLS